MVGSSFSRMRGYFLLIVSVLALSVLPGCGGHTAGTNPPTKLLSIDTIALNSNGDPVAGVQITNSLGESVLTNENGEASLQAALGSDLIFFKDGLTTTAAVIPNDPNALGIVYAVEVREEEIVVVQQGEIVAQEKGSQSIDPLISEEPSPDTHEPKGKNEPVGPSATPTPAIPEPEPEALALVEGTLPNVEDGSPSTGAQITVNDQSGSTNNGIFSVSGVTPQFRDDGTPYFEVEVRQKSGDTKFTVELPIGFDFFAYKVELAFNYRANQTLGYRLRMPERQKRIKVPTWGDPTSAKPEPPDTENESADLAEVEPSPMPPASEDSAGTDASYPGSDADQDVTSDSVY